MTKVKVELVANQFLFMTPRWVNNMLETESINIIWLKFTVFKRKEKITVC